MPFIFPAAVPPARQAAIRDLFNAQNGYMATLPSGAPNPETPAQFFQRSINRFIFDCAKARHRILAAESAAATAEADADSSLSF